MEKSQRKLVSGQGSDEGHIWTRAAAVIYFNNQGTLIIQTTYKVADLELLLLC